MMSIITIKLIWHVDLILTNAFMIQAFITWRPHLVQKDQNLFFFYFSFPYISIQGPCMDCTFEPSQKPLHEVCHVETGDHLMQISPYKRKQDYQSKLLSCRHSSQNMNNKRAKKILINLKDNLPKKFTNNSYLAQ